MPASQGFRLFVLQYFFELFHSLDIPAGELNFDGSRELPVHEYLEEIDDLR